MRDIMEAAKFDSLFTSYTVLELTDDSDDENLRPLVWWAARRASGVLSCLNFHRLRAADVGCSTRQRLQKGESKGLTEPDAEEGQHVDVLIEGRVDNQLDVGSNGQKLR